MRLQARSLPQVMCLSRRDNLLVHCNADKGVSHDQVCVETSLTTPLLTDTREQMSVCPQHAAIAMRMHVGRIHNVEHSCHSRIDTGERSLQRRKRLDKRSMAAKLDEEAHIWSANRNALHGRSVIIVIDMNP